MGKVKLTISLSEDLARYVRAKPNASGFIAAAVADYRLCELERSLEAAYREDAAESDALNRIWRGVDSEIEQ